MENSIKGPDPPPPLLWKKSKVFFSETRPFFEQFFLTLPLDKHKINNFGALLIAQGGHGSLWCPS